MHDQNYLKAALIVIFVSPLLILGCATPVVRRGETVAALRKRAGNQDLSARYAHVFGDPTVTTKELKRDVQPLSGIYQVLLVEGFLEDLVQPFVMRDIYNTLRNSGFFTQFANNYGLGSTMSLDVGRPILLRAIDDLYDRTHRPIILVSHSLGGLRCLDILLRGNGTEGKIAGWISVQGAIRGSPLADRVDAFLPTSVEKGILYLMNGGDVTVIRDLRADQRDVFMSEKSDDVARMISRVPVLFYASSSHSPLNWIYAVMVGKGIESDGLVPVDRAYLPGAPMILDDGGGAPDHVTTVMRGFPWSRARRYDRARFILSLLKLWGESAERLNMPGPG